MRWRRREEGENPAWPGLVDVFAFTLVFVMLLWLSTDLPQEIEKLQKEKAAYQQQLQELENSIKDLRDQVAKLQEIMSLGRQRLQDLLAHLELRVDKNNFSLTSQLDYLEIKIHGEPLIYFGTARYELVELDQERLKHLAPILYETLRGQPFYILINGTADPREMRDRLPPRDNIQLSALRAATVAALLEKAAPGLGDYLRIVGLGVKGREMPLPIGADPDEFYRPYRTVDLVIKVDLEKLLEQPQAAP